MVINRSSGWVARAEVSSARSCGSTLIIPSASQSRSCYARGRGGRNAECGAPRTRSVAAPRPRVVCEGCASLSLEYLTNKFEVHCNLESNSLDNETLIIIKLSEGSVSLHIVSLEFVYSETESGYNKMVSSDRWRRVNHEANDASLTA